MPILRIALLAAVALTAAALALAPAPASAVPAFYEVEYDVEVELTANWSIEKKDVDQYPKKVMGGSAAVKVTGKIDNVLFRNGKLLSQQPGGYLTVGQPTGGAYWERTDWDGQKKQEVKSGGDCGPHIVTEGTNAWVQRTESQPNPNAERLKWRLASYLPLGFNCPDLTSGADLAQNITGLPGILDTTFELPLEAIGMGKIIQHVSARDDQRTPAHCPDGGEHVTGCHFDWNAKLTFVKTGEWQYNGDLDPETPTDPVHGPHIDPRAEAIIHAVSQYGKDAPIDPRAEAVSHAVDQYGKDEPAWDPRADAVSKAVEQYGQELRFEAQCQGGCTGTAEILPGRKPLSAHGSAVASAAARKALAKVKFRVPAGKPRKIKVRLPRKAARAVKKAGGAKVKLTFRPKRGKAKVVTLALRQGRR